jgi:hypothetical protein
MLIDLAKELRFGRIFDALAAFCSPNSTLKAVVAAHDLWPLSKLSLRL